MIVKDGKIIEATDSELFEYWLQRYDEIMTYEAFKFACTANGVRIVEEARD